MPDALTHVDLQQFIDANGITAAIIPLKDHTATVADAARALEVDTAQIIKSLLFLVDGEALLVINSGTARVDRKKLAAFLGVGRKRVKFATPDQALSVTGYVVGSMPPFGHRQRLQTLVDAAVTRLETVYGGGGALNAMLRLTTAELLRVTGPEVVAVAEEGGS
jgi:Cys-tRNA(Pro) deacylase